MKHRTEMPRCVTRAARCAAVLLAVLPAGAPAQIAVQDNTLQQREARPGETYDGTIVVANLSDEPQEARLYQTDYLFFADGRAMYHEPGTDPRSNARWITVNPTSVTVPPRSKATVRYAVSVPSGSERPLSGSYWSAIMVEAVAPALAKAAGEEQGLGITTRIRYGVQVVTHIAGTGEVRLDFADPRIGTDAGGARSLEFDILNVGERSVPLDVRVELFDASGERAGTFRGAVRILHPGTSVRQRFALGALRAGAYEAVVTADTGSEIFGAQYTLRF
ncbi:MAG TPA: hypothetical protein VF158_05685 [Longimicrobiales bacterium]